MSAETVHGLGTVHSLGAAVVAAVALCASAWTSRPRGSGEVRRARRLLEGPRAARVRGARTEKARAVTRSWLPACAAGLGAALLIGGVAGGLAGPVVALGGRVAMARRRTAAAGRAAEPEPADLSLSADLIAACLAAGASPGEAAGAVGRCVGGPLGAALLRAEAELRLGGDPAECWDRVSRLPAARAIGRCLARASTTGSAPAAEMTRLAADHRATHGRAALARARRAAVLATAPLGVCFLPAFLLVGVVPVVVGLSGAVLGGSAGPGGG